MGLARSLGRDQDWRDGRRHRTPADDAGLLAELRQEIAQLPSYGLGLVLDQLWPNYVRAAAEARLSIDHLGTELVLGGWSPRNGRMMATAYAKNDSTRPTIVQCLDGGLASPGEPLAGRPDSFAPADVLAAGKIQATWLNARVGRQVAGGRLLATVLREGQAVTQDLGAI